jgi:hypothetical protein
VAACKAMVEAAHHSGRMIGFDSQAFDAARAALAKTEATHAATS